MEKTRAELFMDWMESVNQDIGEGLSWGETVAEFPDISLEWTKGNELTLHFKDQSTVSLEV